jgi:hypothetical protein
VKKPHPVGLAAKPNTPWVTECPCCGCDLYRTMGDIEDDAVFQAWLRSAWA